MKKKKEIVEKPTVKGINLMPRSIEMAKAIKIKLGLANDSEVFRTAVAEMYYKYVENNQYGEDKKD
jgi:hypothetical protein